jgi:Flp pilus assembly protein TadG
VIPLPRRRRVRRERGSAIVDFALVSVVLVPLFFGVLQLALIWYVKTTLTSAASDGAHYGATYSRTAADGGERTRAVIADVFGHRLPTVVSARQTSVDGQPGVEVDVRAGIPVLAFWGPTVTVDVSGHAVQEVLP